MKKYQGYLISVLVLFLALFMARPASALNPEEMARLYGTPAPLRAADNIDSQDELNEARARLQDDSRIPVQRDREGHFQGDPKLIREGFSLKKSLNAPRKHLVNDNSYNDGGVASEHTTTQSWQPPRPPSTASNIPPGSRAPYYNGQMTSNPSLWPDEGQGASLFKDFRAFQAMDILTVLINESSSGKKSADTDTKSEFSILAGITEFFGLETRKWAANNTSLDPTALINASTDTEFKGEGETERTGTLIAKMSALIVEVLPNGLLRIEGNKIVSLNNEEEIMVISGLVRQRDITSRNEVDSGRIANMRVDFYGRGVVAEQQQPGWGARIIDFIWPF